ncbi:glycosyltransferase [Cohnella sp.]|uniref:glycosyltransferase n=1 Tax=Cohnella sp. TaxID=1883426 RepID=UPI003567C438
MQVVFRNTFYEPTGFGNSARQIAYKMEDAGIDVKIEALGKVYHCLDDAELQRLHAMENKPLQEEQVLLTLEINRHPHERSRFKKALSCTMWETSKAPEEMIHGINQFDGLIIPNEFNRQSFLNGGARIPLFIAPYGVDSDLYRPEGPRDRLGESENLFIFLSVFGWSERKAPHILLNAYLEEFHTDEPVLLMIKTFGNDVDNFPLEWYEEATQDITSRSDLPRVRLITKTMAPRQMAAFYRGADCFVMPTRGEGVGLPILESMACQKPVIATGWSSHVEFLNPSNGYLIPYRLLPAKPLHYTELYKSDQIWADADAGSLQLLMRRVYSQRQEAWIKAIHARETARKWNWDRTAQAFIEAIELTVGVKVTTRDLERRR